MKILDEEHQQILLMNWLHRNYPDVWEVTHHSPNGGHRHIAVASKLKLMGTKKGFPDLVSYWREGGFTGLVIEMKVGKGRTTTEQKKWLKVLKVLGFKTAVCHGLEEGKQAFQDYLQQQDQTG